MEKRSEEKPKKSPRKYKHLESFSLQEKGGYAYSGTYMVCASGEKEYKDSCRRLLAIAGASAALFVAAGCFPSTGMEGTAILLIPYVTALVAGVLLCLSLFSMGNKGPKLRRYEYEKIVWAAQRRTAETIAGSAIGIIAYITLLIRGTFKGTLPGAAVLAIAYTAGLSLSLYIYRKLKAYTWREEGTP